MSDDPSVRYGVVDCPICGGDPHGPYVVDGRVSDDFLFRPLPEHRKGVGYTYVVFVGCGNPECGVMIARTTNQADESFIKQTVTEWNNLGY